MSDEIASSDAVGIDAFEAAAVSGEAEQPDAPEFDDDDFDTVEEAEDFEPEEPDEEDDAEVDEIDEDAFDGPRRLTAQERIRELVQEKNTYKDQLTEKTKALEDLVAQIAAAEKAQTGFIEVDRGRIDRQLADLTNLATSLEAGGRYHDAAQVRGEINRITAALAENNRRQRTSVSQRQARLRAQQHHQAAVTNTLGQLGHAAETFRAHHNIPRETWDRLGTKFFEACHQDPVLGREFAERATSTSPSATVKWVYEEISKRIGKAAAKSLLTRQQAKQDGGTVGISNSGAAAGKTPKTYDQLMGLPQRERDLIYKNNRKLWNRLMDQA